MKRQVIAPPKFGRVVFKPGILREIANMAALEAQCAVVCVQSEQNLVEAKALAHRILMRLDKHQRDLTGIVSAMIPVLRRAGFVKEERQTA